MIRYPHYWWPLKGQRFPARIAVLDCDAARCSYSSASRVQTEELTRWSLTVSRLHRGEPGLVNRASGERVLPLWGALASLLSSKDRTWLFVTPASRILGLIGFWPRLEAGQIVLAGRDRRANGAGGREAAVAHEGVCVIEDPPTVILCLIPDRPGKLLILDARNWGIDPLDPETDCDTRAGRYLRGLCDCVRTLRASGQGSLSATAASQAVRSLRTCWPVARLHCHTHGPALALERAALYGGRCEAYRLGEITGPLYHVDVRNMYPSICLDLPVPVSLRRYHADGPTAERMCRDRAATAIAHVRVRSPRPEYPLRRNGLCIYPTGEYSTTLAGPELARAVAADHITRWHSGAEYACAPVLAGFYRRWLDSLATARQDSREMAAQWIKRVMNALPGKFAEPGREWHPAPASPEHGPYGQWFERGPDGELRRYRNVARDTQWEETHGESYWSMPAVAAFITAAGRVKLWDYICAAGIEHTRYVDTDSLITDGTGFDRLLSIGAIRDGTTGHLRLLGRHSRGRIFGIRHYDLDGVIRCAGVPRGAIEPGESRGEYWHRQQIAAEIALGRAPRAERRLGIYPTAVEYCHGDVQADGRVTPFEIQET